MPDDMRCLRHGSRAHGGGDYAVARTVHRVCQPVVSGPGDGVVAQVYDGCAVGGEGIDEGRRYERGDSIWDER